MDRGLSNVQDELNSILDENILIAEQTHCELENQGQQIEDMERKLINIEYITRKGKDILNRMQSFFHRFRTQQITTIFSPTESSIQMNEISPEDLFVSNDTTLNKLDRLKKLGLKIGEELDDQNIKLDKMDIEIDKNSSYQKKNVEKINKIL